MTPKKFVSTTQFVPTTGKVKFNFNVSVSILQKEFDKQIKF